MTIHLVFLKPKVFFCFYAYTRVCVQCMWHKYCHQHGTFFLTARTLYAQLTHMQWIFFAAFSWYQTNFWLLNNTGPARCITVEKETETKQQQTFGDATTINDNVDECLYKGVKRYTQKYKDALTTYICACYECLRQNWRILWALTKVQCMEKVPLLERMFSNLKVSGVSKAKIESLSWMISRSSSSSQKDRWKPS